MSVVPILHDGTVLKFDGFEAPARGLGSPHDARVQRPPPDAQRHPPEHATYHGVMTFGHGFCGAHTESVTQKVAVQAVMGFFESKVWPTLQGWLPDCDPSRDKVAAFRYWVSQPNLVTVTNWDTAKWFSVPV